MKILRERSALNNEQYVSWQSVLIVIGGVSAIALAFYAYSAGLQRPFVADDYQWLVNVRGLSFAELLRTADNPTAQHHFYRPLVWLLIWIQMQVFGTDPSGYHIVSLALHLCNAALVGGLVWRLRMRETQDRETRSGGRGSSFPLFLFSMSCLAASIVALHPAIFEAVTWVSAQSELLSAMFLLLMLHCWLRRPSRRQGSGVRGQGSGTEYYSLTSSPLYLFTSSLPATLLLALALLTKESAVIGLPLLWLFDRRLTTDDWRPQFGAQVQQYVLPVLLVCVYLGLQVVVERNNYLLQRGSYGLGWQLLLNPLRSLALIVAPLANTEHADAAWLVPVGALVVAGIFALWLRRTHTVRCLAVALVITLLPTAPFLSPPDSRYLYLPVLFAVVLVGFTIYDSQFMIERVGFIGGRWSMVGGLFAMCLLLGALGAAATEVRAREQRWSAAGGPGGSLWHVAEDACAEKVTKRVVVVEPPLLAEHVQAIVTLACGDDTQAVVVARADVDGAVKRRTVVISFPEGSAVVERRR